MFGAIRLHQKKNYLKKHEKVLIIVIIIKVIIRIIIIIITIMIIIIVIIITIKMISTYAVWCKIQT